MKKKLVTLMLLTALSASITACGTNNAPTSTNQADTEKSESISENSETDDTSSPDLNSVGDIEVEKELFDVKITIPADFVNGQTQEELNKVAAENDIHSITLNSDGSATYIMSKSQHKNFIEKYRDELDKSMNELVGSDDYPNFTKIEANDNYTEFTVTTKSTELDLSESFSAMIFYMSGGMYNLFNGETVDNISVTYVNEDTGEIISVSNSKDMQ